MSDCVAITERLVRARSDRRALAAFPSKRPADLAAAYRIQDAAIDRWPDRLVGWKVGRVPAGQQQLVGASRLMGPIFAAVEAEIVLAGAERVACLAVLDALPANGAP